MSRNRPKQAAYVFGQGGFTLVELLVVIGIIGLLISILLPALSRARDYSKAVACQNSLRQIWTATAMYANDNREWFPGAALMGDFISRRAPGEVTPGDPSAKPEVYGLAAILHGIAGSDYTNVAFLQANVMDIMGRRPRYLGGRSPVWMCPAADDETRSFLNTYSVSANTRLENPLTILPGQVITPRWNTFKRRSKTDDGKDLNAPWVFDNVNIKPYLTGFRGGTGTGYTVSAANKSPYLPHKRKGVRYANVVYLDGRFDIQEH